MIYLGSAAGTVVVMNNQFGVARKEATLDFHLNFFIYLVFYVYVAFRLLNMIIDTVNVNIGLFYGAVIAYLLIGIIGGYILMFIENEAPGSINILESENITTPNKFFYFSFITLSTLGNGGITRLSAPARTVSMILCAAGPLYLTILVALLISRLKILTYIKS